MVCYVSSYSYYFVFFKQKTAYEMRISDWSSDVCSSDLLEADKRGSGTAQSDEAAVADLKVGRRVLDVEARAIATLAGQLDGGFADAVARLAEVEGRGLDRKSVQRGRSVSVRLNSGGGANIKKKKITSSNANKINT